MTSSAVQPLPDTGQLQLPDGRRLLWHSVGPAQVPVVLWLHGSTGSARTAPVASGVRVLSYDRPGYGGSDFDPARTLLSDASDVEALLDHFKIATVRVLAFSGGAPSAYAVGARLQERVEHIGIVSGAVWPTAAAPSSEAVSAAAESLRADPEAAVARLGDNAPMRDAEVLADPSSATTAST